MFPSITGRDSLGTWQFTALIKMLKTPVGTQRNSMWKEALWETPTMFSPSSLQMLWVNPDASRPGAAHQPELSFPHPLHLKRQRSCRREDPVSFKTKVWYESNSHAGADL